MKFKEFILNEEKSHFSLKAADILTALQDLNETLSTMGAKHIVSNSQNIVNQIRRIIHTHWPESEENNILTLQKCGVAIMRAIEEKDELESILKACEQQIEQMLSKSNYPINDLSA